VPVKKNYKLSGEFVNKLAGYALGYIRVETFESILSLIEEKIPGYYFTFSSESNLLRIISSLYDRVTFLTDCLKYPNYIDLLLSISVNSNYLTDIIVRNPEYFYWILTSSNLNARLEERTFEAEIKKIAASFKTFNAKLNALRFIKRKEILRIGAKDISGSEDLVETTRQLSILAKVLTGMLFGFCYREVLKRNKIRKADSEYCMIALGKLGGNELNYSSDVDLMIFYDDNALLPNNKYYNEVLSEAVFLFIESSSSITGEGYIYRVDFRLRPDGRNSPLCGSFNEYLTYYESRGEDWERQMLIKSRFITGSKSLYNKFSGAVSHFIYPVTFSNSPTAQIKKLKQSIEKNLKDDENIKLAAGGIRDIEFSVQALQLLNGGRNPGLRDPNTISSILNLRKNDLLSEDEMETLAGSYFFYRKIEHYLQLMNDAQTHSIPADGEILEKLSKFLGFSKSNDFKSAVTENREAVIKIYNSIMGLEVETSGSSEGLDEIKFRNRKQAEKDISFLREGKGLLGQKLFDKSSSEQFEKIIPGLKYYLIRSADPDRVLQNFSRVIRSSNFPSIWYREFSDEVFFQSFLRLCEFSQKSIDLFAEDSDLGEFLLTRKIFTHISTGDMTGYSVKKVLFILSVQFSLKLIAAEVFSDILSSVILGKIKSMANDFFKKKGKGPEYFIAALGSLGSGEMTSSSDIDLIFVVKDLEKQFSIQEAFQKLLNIIKENLKPFDVDCRLRPEGKNSQLVWDLNGYIKYIRSRARTWEMQSLCKLNFISGDVNSFNEFINAAANRISNEDITAIRNDIHDMRKKLYPKDISTVANIMHIKRSRGGLSDIEFTLQYFLLQSEDLFLKCAGKNTLQIISILSENILEKEEAERIRSNYLFLKKIQLINHAVFNVSTSILSLEKNKLDILCKQTDFSSANDLQLYISKIIKENYSFFEKHVS